MSEASEIPADLLASVAAEANAARSLSQIGTSLVRRLAGHIAFDRFNIGLIDSRRHMFLDAYVFGRNVTGRATGHERTLDGTVVEAAMQAGSAFRFGAADRDRWIARFPRFAPVFDSGIRAMMAVPLNSAGRTAAALVFASTDPSAYGPEAAAMATAIGRTIANRIVTLAESATE